MNPTRTDQHCRMRVVCFFCLGAIALSGLVAGAVIIGQLGRQKAGDAQEIPLKESYAYSFDQNMFKDLWQDLGPGGKSCLLEIEANPKGLGPSNIFLVRGDNIDLAVVAMSRVFSG